MDSRERFDQVTNAARDAREKAAKAASSVGWFLTTTWNIVLWVVSGFLLWLPQRFLKAHIWFRGMATEDSYDVEPKPIFGSEMTRVRDVKFVNRFYIALMSLWAIPVYIRQAAQIRKDRIASDWYQSPQACCRERVEDLILRLEDKQWPTVRDEVARWLSAQGQAVSRCECQGLKVERVKGQNWFSVCYEGARHLLTLDSRHQMVGEPIPFRGRRGHSCYAMWSDRGVRIQVKNGRDIVSDALIDRRGRIHMGEGEMAAFSLTTGQSPGSGEAPATATLQ